MAKKRVYEVAEEFDLSSKALMALLEEIGIEVKNHMSTLDEEAVDQISRHFEQERAAIRRREEERQKKRERVEDEHQAKEEGEKSVKTIRRRKSVAKVASETAAGVSGTEEVRVERKVRETPAKMEGSPKRKKRKKEEPEEDREAEAVQADSTATEQRVIQASEFISVSDLAKQLEVSPSKVIATCMDLGLMVTINQRVDYETISLICEEFGVQAELAEEYGLERLETEEEKEAPTEPRPPIVTVMGHVDHGKTALLDYIRKTNVIAGEAGGITQHIGSYAVSLPEGAVTFIDTPGHQAFTAMRARGAQVTDIVVLVVAANEGVKPQTVEAIHHAQAAGVPIAVAINKMDLPEADPNRVKRGLMEHGIVVEELGGKVACVEISAKTGVGVQELLEIILFQAELLELKAPREGAARGVVIEARLDRGMGSVATVLIGRGTLKVGDPVICGLQSGKVRAMLDERGNQAEEAGPSTPVQVVGFSGVPQAGDSFYVVDEERDAREISQVRQRLQREQHIRAIRPVSLEEFHAQMEGAERRELNVVLKADTDGSVEALADALENLSGEEVAVRVIHSGVGAISESDVLLAAASEAIVIGFHVRPDPGGREAAEQEGVEIRLYQVIYDAVREIRDALEGLLEPEEKEVFLGSAEVRETFRIPRVGTVAGCYVQEGIVPRGAKVRVLRDHVPIYQGQVSSLKRFKDDVREVKSGLECGIGIEAFNDVKVGDILEAYRVEQVKRTLEEAHTD